MENIKKDTLEKLTELGIEKNSFVYEIFDHGFELVPYLGNLVQSIKIRRLGKRLEVYEQQLSEINILLKTEKNDMRFVKERVFPIVLDDLIEEHQDKKIDFILNGMKNILIENLVEESEILGLFDTLKEMRLFDIIYLQRFDYEKEVGSIKEEHIENNGEINPLTISTIYKLIRLGLIREMKLFTYGEDGKSDIGEKELVLTSYGRRFIRFLISK